MCKTFLEAVASACAARYADMSDICFLFPNKRSGTFFLKALSESLGERTMLAPEVLGVSEFMARISGREPASRIDLIFRLYKVYTGLLGRNDSLRTEDDLLDFDRFAPWAETLISDFSEVEKYDADADALFQNVRDYREISSNFLSEEQLDVIERYFGYRPDSGDAERFWKSVGPEEERTDLKRKFVELWRLLPELYNGLLANLEIDGLALEGTTFRRAMRQVADRGLDALPWSRVVVVGFNMLSTTESRLFVELRDLVATDGDPYGVFFWDATGPVLDPSSGSRNTAAVAMRRNVRNFPMPVWASEEMLRCSVDVMPPEITVAASPSNVAQVKIASMQIDRWLGEEKGGAIDDARAAIVIPDENLLLPLIHSLPAGLKSVNLTMGYSMRFTAVASFIYHLRRLQTRQRKSGGNYGYFADDFRLFMAHPLVGIVAGATKANEISSEVARLHLRVVTHGWIADHSPVVAEMLTPLDADTSVDDTVAYIMRVLDIVDDALVSDGGGAHTVNSKIERMQISVYCQALARLLTSVTVHGISMRFNSVFHLADRLIAGETVTFEGEPLEGLQIMGLLETRALDFDRLVILSMNDKVMPRRSRARTFIPDAMRRSYGLPLSTRSEELYAYYFYRLISRARDVTLIYDARAGEGMRSGGKSRFLLQLSMLHAVGKIREKNYSFFLRSSEPESSPVVKTESVMARLREFENAENGRNLSASALMDYCRCQVLFYYKDVVGLRDDSVAADHIDPITQGNIIHRAMLNLYFPPQLQNKYLTGRILMTPEKLSAIAADRELIGRQVTRAVNREHFRLAGADLDRPLSGAVALVAERYERMIRNVVACDEALAPFELVGGEISGYTRLRIGGAPELNFRYAFDRVDFLKGHLRIVDYKTGHAYIEAKDFEDIFSGAYKARYLLQLMLYAELLGHTLPEAHKRLAGEITLAVYDVNRQPDEVECRPVVGRETIDVHAAIAERFREGLEGMLKEIFNPDEPFRQTDDPLTCATCSFRSLCNR